MTWKATMRCAWPLASWPHEAFLGYNQGQLNPRSLDFITEPLVALTESEQLALEAVPMAVM